MNNNLSIAFLMSMWTVTLATSQVGPAEPETPDQRNYDGRYHKPGPTSGYGPSDDDSSKPLSWGANCALMMIAACFGLFLLWRLTHREAHRPEPNPRDNRHWEALQAAQGVHPEQKKNVQEGNDEQENNLTSLQAHNIKLQKMLVAHYQGMLRQETEWQVWDVCVDGL